MIVDIREKEMAAVIAKRYRKIISPEGWMMSLTREEEIIAMLYDARGFLDLNAMLTWGRDMDIAHDVAGLWARWSPSTQTFNLTDCWTPRFSR